MKYRSVPSQCEATQWFKDGDHPGVISAKSLGHPGVNNVWMVQTACGLAEVFAGDFIIDEPNAPGKHYPCRPDVFARRWTAA
jgi:hypothetical protein